MNYLLLLLVSSSSSSFIIGSVDSFSLSVSKREISSRTQSDHSIVATTTSVEQVQEQQTILSKTTTTINDDDDDDNNKHIIWKIRPCENPTRIQMFHWYICGIIDAIRHPIITTTTTQSQQYFVPSITTRRRLSFLLYILDPRRRRRHMEESQQNRIVLLATTIPQHPHTTVVVGRFGIVIEPGPVVPSPLQEAIHRIYTNQNSNHSSNNSSNISTTTSSKTTIKNDDDDDDADDTIRAGAIVYMYVAPEYRGIQNNIGGRALQVIHTIQRSCHCTYTLLVANDKTPPSDTSTTTTITATARTGSDHDNDATTTTITSMRYNDMKLVQWYRRNGYHIAEEIQDMLGSPNGIYGVAMITSLWHHNNNTMNYDVAIPIIQWW